MNMDNMGNEVRAGAFQVWMGQWRLTTLETEGCMFVLRFLLRAFHSRKPEDRFWSFLERFLFAEDHQQTTPEDNDYCTHPPKELLSHAGSLPPEQARALLAYLSECYAIEGDRSFWNTVSEAVQLYTVAPYDAGAAGTA